MTSIHEYGDRTMSRADGASGRSNGQSRWTELDAALNDLDARVRELELRGNAAGQESVSELKQVCAKVRREAQALKHEAEKSGSARLRERAEWASRTVRDNAERLTSAWHRSREARAKAAVRAEGFRLGARDLGQGLKRAWGELRQAIASAAGRFSERRTNQGER